jgi:lipoprotein-anchoring transpeptidase ErfK/SrfK
LEKGVLIVVSIASQTGFVFRKGEEWDWTQVSTGRPGNDTPTGEFPILQKKLHHLSNLYDDAPMPFMQRLTWDGVALHAGRVTGAPASHGCIRLPAAFAKKLYEVTDFTSTLVLVTDAPLESAEDARKLA